MATPPTLHVRSMTLGLIGAVALASLTACGPKSGTTQPDNRPSSKSAASPKAQKPNNVQHRSASEIYNAGTEGNSISRSFREQSTSSVYSSDLRLSATECAGNVTLHGKGSFDIVQQGNDSWAKVDAAFAAFAKSNDLEVPAETWMRGTRNNPMMKALGSYCHREQFTNPDKASSKLTKGALSVVDGQPTTTLVNKVDAGTSITYHVSTTGVPHLLKREVKGRESVPTIIYSDFAQPVGATAPSGKVVPAPTTK